MTDVRGRATAKPYDLAVFIGRFQPFHKGHMGVIEHALESAERVLVLVGSANRARDTRNPFTYQERETLIDDALASKLQSGERERVDIMPLDDAPYDLDAWLSNVHRFVKNATKAIRPHVALIGHERDQSSDYLKMFPQWDYIAAKDTATNATSVRKAFFTGAGDFHRTGWSDTGEHWPDVIHDSTIDFLNRFRDNPEFARLMREKKAEEAYGAQYGKGPFLTVDPVVTQSGYVLLVERGGPEGNGQWALPGGFLNPYETLLDGAVRECFEETDLFGVAWAGTPSQRMPEAQRTALLKTHLKGSMRFDDPHRSRRASIITEAFLFRLPDSHGLPQVVGKDDAKTAFWLPISEVRPDRLYDDHAFIIDKLLNLF